MLSPIALLTNRQTDNYLPSPYMVIVDGIVSAITTEARPTYFKTEYKVAF